MKYLFLFGILANLAYADTRFENYCVTTPTQKDIVLVYDDLISSEADDVSGINLVNSVEILKFENGIQLPKYTNFLHQTSTDEMARNKKMTNFEVFVRKNSSNISKINLANNSTSEISGHDLITIKMNNELTYSFPYFESSNNGKGYGEIFAKNLIFNGKKVASIIYYDCGMDSN
jgi:hypothetical protein